VLLRIFYQALRQCGTEFSMMQMLIPGRTRDQLKLKFQREERQHPELVKRALETSVPLELTPFEVQLGPLMVTRENDNTNENSNKRRKKSIDDQLIDPIFNVGLDDENDLIEF
jgi:transcription factor TFIIIB component B''